jgi:hypothetical protein
MNDPQQVLLHLTSRGNNVRTLVPGAAGKFLNQTKQPIKNINKFGLLHYSVPKVLDFLTEENRTFSIRLTFGANAAGASQSVEIPVTLPLMDYYNMRLDDMDVTETCFTEVLQSTINWAIQKQWTANHYQNMQVVMAQTAACSNRISCIARVSDDGRLQFLFGYRGFQNGVINGTGAANANDPYNHQFTSWHGPIFANTGTPLPVDGTAAVGNLQAVEESNGSYRWVDCQGVPRDKTPFGLTANIPAGCGREFQLKKVAFFNMSSRLQFLFGSNLKALESNQLLQKTFVDQTHATTQISPSLMETRGRIILASYLPKALYHTAGNADHRLGIVDFTMPIPPNMYPPSFLFLQLTAQGTKTKVLGHSAERGGWSVPCAANQFKSKWDNFPKVSGGTYAYDLRQARNVPALLNAQVATANAEFIYEKYHTAGNNGPLLQPARFDQIPYSAFTGVGPGAFAGFLQMNNYSLVPIPNATGTAANKVTDARFGSRIIHFGDLISQKAMAQKKPREQFGIAGRAVVEAPTFTVSMIDPTWIYTDVPNSTLQSLDCLLMWGDTSENITDVCANPVQISLIASQ